GAAPCSLREANREIAKSVLNDADYDLGFLFSTGSSGGCAWYVVCLTSDDTLHKARGAGHFSANGLGLGTGLLLHEVGHQLGAKHTYSGQASGCNLCNFDGDDGDGTPSAWEPGSGSTIMSYSGSCDSDDVDLNLIGTGQYYHTKSFEQIVDNITSGTGSTCAGSINTGNLAPTVSAGADHTIPRQTPFTLSGTGMDGQTLTFAWEQIDLATTQRPIDTDDGVGPIIRSVPPGTLPTRTIPDIRDLLANVNRAGELLPQVDRTLNFRLTARDNQPGGGGVASDEMVVTTQGAPFFITSPNSGSLQAGCSVPVTWEIGGGSIANNVDVLYSTTGGLDMSIQESFPQVIVPGTANDGEHPMMVPCANTTGGRIKVMASDNIFFDVNDNDLTVLNDPPDVTVDPITNGEVDDVCEFTVDFTATATDSCGVSAADVDVILVKEPPGEYTLGTPTINKVQNGPTQVDVSGSVLVSDLLSSPAVLQVRVEAEDNCGATDVHHVLVEIADTTPPEISVSVDPSTLWPPDHKMNTIKANVVASDNCPGVSYVLADATSDELDNGTGIGDGNTVNDIQNADLGTPDLDFDLRSERDQEQDGRTYTVTYTATDGSDNSNESSATVTVAHDQN
ncbi:MAG: reprolysin-like metallopeptidase, partial [bacterium]